VVIEHIFVGAQATTVWESRAACAVRLALKDLHPSCWCTTHTRFFTRHLSSAMRTPLHSLGSRPWRAPALVNLLAINSCRSRTEPEFAQREAELSPMEVSAARDRLYAEISPLIHLSPLPPFTPTLHTKTQHPIGDHHQRHRHMSPPRHCRRGIGGPSRQYLT
jgi:hypothetical protein